MKDEFKKGDYIVVLEDNPTINSWQGLVLKQREDGWTIKPVKLLNGGSGRGRDWGNYNLKNIQWRYATHEEITHYDLLGKPYHISELEQKEEQDYSYLIEFIKKINANEC